MPRTGRVVFASLEGGEVPGAVVGDYDNHSSRPGVATPRPAGCCRTRGDYAGASAAPRRPVKARSRRTPVRRSSPVGRRVAACTACHDIRTNGADGHRRDKVFDGSELALNTSTVFNAALSFRLNWEGNFRTFETEAETVLDNRQILGTSVEEVLAKLRADPETVHQFEEVYGHPPDRPSLLDAIATYEQSLLTPGSRFDRWLDGDAAALSAAARPSV